VELLIISETLEIQKNTPQSGEFWFPRYKSHSHGSKCNTDVPWRWQMVCGWRWGILSYWSWRPHSVHVRGGRACILPKSVSEPWSQALTPILTVMQVDITTAPTRCL